MRSRVWGRRKNVYLKVLKSIFSIESCIKYRIPSQVPWCKWLHCSSPVPHRACVQSLSKVAELLRTSSRHVEDFPPEVIILSLISGYLGPRSGSNPFKLFKTASVLIGACLTISYIYALWWPEGTWTVQIQQVKILDLVASLTILSFPLPYII